MISVCILSIGRESIYETLKWILSQNVKVEYEIIIILQWFLDRQRLNLINKNQVKIYIYNFDSGLWFGFYRNQAINKSNGSVVVFIDDDEKVMSDSWLSSITKPIFSNKYHVVTAGCSIPLLYGYWTNCISLLGYPGWWALWFHKVWHVYSDWTTNHLCGWNFAISKKLLSHIGFFELNIKNSCDDTFLSYKVLQSWFKIFYEPDATLFHPPRSFSDLYSWQSKRILWMSEFFSAGWGNFLNLRNDKIHHVCSIMKYSFLHPTKLFGIFFIIFYIIILWIKIRIKKRTTG